MTVSTLVGSYQEANKSATLPPAEWPTILYLVKYRLCASLSRKSSKMSFTFCAFTHWLSLGGHKTLMGGSWGGCWHLLFSRCAFQSIDLLWGSRKARDNFLERRKKYARFVHVSLLFKSGTFCCPKVIIKYVHFLLRTKHTRMGGFNSARSTAFLENRQQKLPAST